METSDFWKYLALGAAAVYVYQIAQKNGGTLAGNDQGIALNPGKIVDSIMPWIDVHPVTRSIIKHGATRVLNGFAGIDDE